MLRIFLWFLILGPMQNRVPQCNNERMFKRNSKCKLNMSSFFLTFFSHQPSSVRSLFTLCRKARYFSRNELKKQKTMKIFLRKKKGLSSYFAELYGRQLCTASLSKKSHLQFWIITQMPFSFHLYLNLKIYSILFILQESYTNDPF